jgi:23S rRNA pseudouridine2605 synthase
MTEQELLELRREKWRVNAKPIRTLDDAHEFIESVGFSLMFPVRPNVQVPTFIGAWAGTDENLPLAQFAFQDPRAKEATELMVRTLRQKYAYEANLFGETPFLVASSVFPFFYGVVGDRNPRQVPKSGPRSDYSPLAVHTFQAIQKDGPISKPQLKNILGGELSTAALDRTLAELWSKLRITRVDYNEEEGAFWDVLFRWSPEPVREGMGLSMAEALTALVSKYLDCVIAAEQTEVEEFFGNFVGRARVRDAVNALLSARELQYIHIGGRSMIQVTPPRLPPPIRLPRAAKPRTLRERARDAQRDAQKRIGPESE